MLRLALVPLLIAPTLALAGDAADLVVADTRVIGASEALGAATTQAIAEYAAKIGAVVRTHDDLRKLAQYEQVKQALGCESEDCDAARLLAGAANAKRLLVPTIALVGGTRVLTLVLFDTADGKVLRRASRELPDDAAVLAAARDAGHLLVTGADPPAAKPRVAILYFENNSKQEELDPLRKGLADMLVSDLSAAEAVQVVERARLEEILAELKLQGSKAFDPASAAKVGKLLGAQFLVLGSYFELLGTLRLDARIVRVETGAIEKTAGANGKRDDFLDLEQKLAAGLAAGLGATLQGEAERKAGGASAADVVEYAKVLELLDAGKRPEAKAALQALSAKKPKFRQAAILARRAGL